jgi:TRAP-type transport system periplasmic protein
VHANASLFKAPEIKRAVQGGQAQIGEILLVNFQNEWRSSAPTACPSWPTATTIAMKLWRAQKPMLEKKLGRAGHDGAVRRALAAAGHLLQEAAQQRRRPEGLKWRAYSPATAASPNWWARSRSPCRPPN